MSYHGLCDAEQSAGKVAQNGMILVERHAARLAAWPLGCAGSRARQRGCSAQGAREANVRVDASVGIRGRNLLNLTYEEHACCRLQVRPRSAPQLQRVLAGGARPLLLTTARLLGCCLARARSAPVRGRCTAAEERSVRVCGLHHELMTSRPSDAHALWLPQAGAELSPKDAERRASMVMLALPAMEAALRAAPDALVFASDDPGRAAMQALKAGCSVPGSHG